MVCILEVFMDSVCAKKLFAKLELLKDSGEDIDLEKVTRAIQFAKKFHEGQKRSSGEPYYYHPIEVAYMVSDYYSSTSVIAASILHDVVEDTEATVGMVLDNFGWRVARLVYALTRDREEGRLTAGELLQEIVNSGDKEACLIKMMDRLHNLKTLEFQYKDRQDKTAKETIELFLAHAMDLGFGIERDVNVSASRVLFPDSEMSLMQTYSRYLFQKGGVALIPSLNKTDTDPVTDKQHKQGNA
jgi:guanosine-3',5'-bis(diphosphate) 3'-pyrophosphohydrolase